jgi:hypothetical protein
LEADSVSKRTKIRLETYQTANHAAHLWRKLVGEVSRVGHGRRWKAEEIDRVVSNCVLLQEWKKESFAVVNKSADPQFAFALGVAFTFTFTS